MKTLVFAITTVVMFGTAFCSKAQEAASVAPKIPVEGYELVWSDEFDGAVLDTAKWGFRALGPRRDAVNTEECASLDQKGHLLLTTRRVGNTYQTAMISTEGKFETTGGYFECRVALQRQFGHWSAFWLQSPTIGKMVGNPAQSGVEIDVFEYLRKFGDGVVHNLHWDGYHENHKHVGGRTTMHGLSKGWHTFGLLWTDREYVFYVDGKQTWRTQQAISRRDEYLILSLEVGKWAGEISKASLPDSLCVDYVRVYKKAGTGLPPVARSREPQIDADLRR